MSTLDVARGLSRLRPDWNIEGPYQFGEVHAIGAHGANTVDVYLDGSSSLTTGLHYMADYGPQVNDPVMVGRLQGSSQSARVVFGPLAPGGTINGGPPTSAPYAGARIFDTKYGVTWWYDGSNWHANGPGLLVARMYLVNNASVPAGGSVPFDTLDYSPVTNTNLSSAAINIPIPGIYRLTALVTWLASVAGAYAYVRRSDTGALLLQGTAASATSPFGSLLSGAVNLLGSNWVGGLYVELYTSAAGTAGGTPRGYDTYFEMEFVSS